MVLNRSSIVYGWLQMVNMPCLRLVVSSVMPCQTSCRVGVATACVAIRTEISRQCDDGSHQKFSIHLRELQCESRPYAASVLLTPLHG